MSVAVGLLLLLISSEDFWEIRKVLDSQDDSVISSGWGIFTVIGIFLVLFYLLFTLLIIFAKIFIGNVFAIGGYRFFILNRTENPSGKNLLYGFKSGHYGNIVLTMFLKNLYISLWTLLLVIPGIIKRYTPDTRTRHRSSLEITWTAIQQLFKAGR